MSIFSVSFIVANRYFLDREVEVNYLKYRIQVAQRRYEYLSDQISDLKERKKQLTKMTSAFKEEEKHYQRVMSKFWSIISMFVTVRSEPVP